MRHVATSGEVSGDEIFRFWKSSSDDQSGKQNMMNKGLWKQRWEKKGTTVFGEKNCFQIMLWELLRITMPKD
jgi:hypothetical protein